LQALWADESFFKVFTFPLLKGDAATALKEPYSILLTEKESKKLFGETDALGKAVRFDTLDYIVTGVMKDVPVFSHIQFEGLVSFSTAELQNQKDKNFGQWESIWSNFVYVLLPEGADPVAFSTNLGQLSTAENAALAHSKINLSLQPLKEIALGPDLSNPIGPVMMISVVWIIGGLTLVVILSACFNYTNLSIARSLRRSREVGIRKVIGALKTHVLTQFICEAVMISLMALGFSFVLFLLLRPQFLSIAPELQRMVTLELSAPVILYFVAFAIAAGVLAGFLPALFFSRINAVSVLKDASSLRVFTNVSLRKALIVVQYTLSLIFIAATIIGYKQYKNFLSFDLGFTTENILNIRLQGNKSELFMKELKELPEVGECSKSLMITSVGNYYGAQMKYNNPQDSAVIWYNSIDDRYLPLHGHRLIAGRNFVVKPKKAEESEVIVNEQILKRFNIAEKNPGNALGEVVTVDGKKLTIIGVLKDFHYGKVDNDIPPVILRYLSEESEEYINAKITSTDWPATLARIDNAWKKVDKVHPLDATFYDDQIERAYGEFSAMLKIIGFLAFLAICIASIGLLGMVIFTTETRLKEISIRKVLGANEGNLIYLLSKGFLILLAISAAIALPATYFFFDRVVLSNIVYHAPIGISDLLTGVVAVMLVALVMIGSQTLKVARSNPAQVLKSE
jgi:ABC-type antimicrobial peptide transport system permease subunit